MKEQGLFHTAASPEPVFSDTLSLNLASVEPSIAGPRRPQDRIRLMDSKRAFRDALPELLPTGIQAPGKDGAKGPAEGPTAVGVWGGTRRTALRGAPTTALRHERSVLSELVWQRPCWVIE